MFVQVENTNLGYVVSVYFDFEKRNNFHWYRICNFGDSQGDAIFYKDYCVPCLSVPQLSKLISDFDLQKIYKLCDISINQH